MNWMRRKAGGNALGQGLADQRLADARHVLQQHVVAGQQGHDAQPHDLGFAQHDLADVRFQLGYKVLQLCRHAVSKPAASALVAAVPRPRIVPAPRERQIAEHSSILVRRDRPGLVSR